MEIEILTRKWDRVGVDRPIDMDCAETVYHRWSNLLKYDEIMTSLQARRRRVGELHIELIEEREGFIYHEGGYITDADDKCIYDVDHNLLY